MDSRWFTFAACENGLRVHAACEQLDLAALAMPELTSGKRISTTILGELESYRRFLRDCHPEYEAIEQGRVHLGLEFGGRPDRICRRLLGGPAVLELKTGQPQEWHGIQLAGYQLLHPAGARYACYLKPNGKYNLRTYSDADDYARFYEALQSWKDGTDGQL